MLTACNLAGKNIMKQEVKVNLTLTMQVDLGCSRTEIVQFVKSILRSGLSNDPCCLGGIDIHRVFEEAEICLHPEASGAEIWSFVEAYYPGYSDSGRILRHDQLSNILIGRLDDYAAGIFLKDFDGETNDVLAAFERSCMEIYGRAILGYFESERQSLSVRWGIAEIYARAMSRGQFWLDRPALFRVLDMLRKKYDRNIGITWGTIDDCLDYINLNPE